MTTVTSVHEPAASLSGTRRARPRDRWNPAPRRTPYTFIAAAVLLFVAVYVVPLGYTVYLSTQKTQVSGRGLGPGARQQVSAGFSNYATVFGDGEFWQSVLRAVIYGCILIPIMLGLATLFALILDSQRVRFQRFGRLAIFLPYAVPTLIGSMIWGMMYLPGFSPINSTLHALFGMQGINFFGQRIVFLSVANIGVWGGTGFNMMVLYTALRSLPQEVYEAARLDGANERKIALRIKLPMIRPAVIMTAIFSTIATLQVFNEPYAMHQIAYGGVSTSWTPLMTVYQDTYTANNVYLGAAESIVIAVMMFVLSAAVLRITNRQIFGGEAR
ncbi:sugar ABC transporter permease [Actinospica sp. MGRD01-02]|uniref:Sugar ABC transporter permease n=1 Tax=Actinospica acidithermotolerans TaxID=2828514 RepID=A0A941EI05_9ACTN|nr:sugar ABC transporter permease [Actinospica acidithermotolerans]MBR7830778.1 sugar ABC transporter permease [Actinospica acidithermotolerans]